MDNVGDLGWISWEQLDLFHREAQDHGFELTEAHMGFTEAGEIEIKALLVRKDFSTECTGPTTTTD